MEYETLTPMQCEILKAAFKAMDEELGIRPVTPEQMQAFRLRLDEIENAYNEQI